MITGLGIKKAPAVCRCSKMEWMIVRDTFLSMFIVTWVFLPVNRN